MKKRLLMSLTKNKIQYSLGIPRSCTIPWVSKPAELDTLIDVYVYFGPSRGSMVNEGVDSLLPQPYDLDRTKGLF